MLKGAGYVLGAFLLLVLGCAAALLVSPRLRAEGYSFLQHDNAPWPPFEIAPGLYYVGSSDIAVYALRTRDGIILIDGGYQSTAARVPENMRRLGLDPASIKIILNTHAHVDHASGIAALKRLSGAQFYASPRDRAELESGGRGDFFTGDWMPYPAVHVDHVLHDGEAVQLGERTLTAHFTPGHTKGCTSWSFPIEVEGREVQALVICSLSTLSYRLVGNDAYPDIVADYTHTYDVLHHLPCDLFLGAHAKWFQMQRKAQALAAGASPNPFVDPQGCRAFIDLSEQRFHAALARQQGR